MNTYIIEKSAPLYISKSIRAMKMKLIWCVKHPKKFTLVTDLVWKNQRKYKDAKTVKILEETLREKRKSLDN